MKKRSVLLVLFLLTGFSTLRAQWPEELITVPEKTQYQQTSTYAEVMDFIEAIEKRTEWMHVEPMGTSKEGKNIPLVVMSNPKITNPQEAKASDKPVMYIQGNIHSGEVEGKEILQILMREILLGEKSHLLDNQIILFAPIYNTDSNDKMAEGNRPSQEGSPVKTGLRSNSQGLDLNRDGIKMEANETRGLVQNVLVKWDPEMLVDLHTTNGTWHGYSLTWAPSYSTAGEPGPYDFTWNELLPEVTQKAEANHDLYFGPYGYHNLRQGWPVTEIYTYNHHPRYMVNQMGLRNKLGILSEAFAHERFYDRMHSTHTFVTEILEFTNKHGKEMASINDKAEEDAIKNVLQNSGKVKKGVQFKMVYLEDIPNYRTYEYIPYEDETGDTKLVRGQRIVELQDIKNYSGFEATVKATLPRGYFIPASMKHIADHLKMQGIEVKRLNKKTTATGEIFEATELNIRSRAFEGHKMASVKGAFKPATRTFNKGDYWVDMAQPLTNLAFYMLEPQSDDGLITWNFFDEYFEAQGISDHPVEYPVFKYFELN